MEKDEDDDSVTGSLSMYQTVTVTPNALRPSMATKDTILANIVGAVEKVNEGTAGQADSYWTWLRSEDVATPTKVAFVLERNAWSDSVDFYTGGLYRFYLSVSQHVKGRDSFARGDIAAATKLIEIRLPGASDSDQEALEDEAGLEEGALEDSGTSLSFQIPVLIALLSLL